MKSRHIFFVNFTILTHNRTITCSLMGVQWLSGRVLDSKPRGLGFEPHQHHCVVSLSKNINPSLVLVQPRKTRPFITERLLMGHKESNQTNKQTCSLSSLFFNHAVSPFLEVLLAFHCKIDLLGMRDTSIY